MGDACGPTGPLLLRRKSDDAHHDDAPPVTQRRPATPRRHPSPNAGPPATPRRHPSPNAATGAAGSQPKRSPSTERRSGSPVRPASGGAGSREAAPSRISAPTSPPSSPSSSSSSSSTPVRDAVSDTQSAPRRLSGGGRAPDGLWPSMRNLSSSLQLESRDRRAAPDQARARDAAAAADRKRSPMRGRTGGGEQPENPHARMIDHHRWPAMMGGRVSGSAMSRSVDLTDKMHRPALSSRGGASPKRTTSVSSAASALSSVGAGRKG